MEARLIDPAEGSKPQPEPGAQAPAPRLVYPWYVVVILMLAMVVSFIDRQVITLLVAPIRADLGISDWLLWDPKVTYTTDGIPVSYDQ